MQLCSALQNRCNLQTHLWLHITLFFSSVRMVKHWSRLPESLWCLHFWRFSKAVWICPKESNQMSKLDLTFKLIFEQQVGTIFSVKIYIILGYSAAFSCDLPGLLGGWKSRTYNSQYTHSHLNCRYNGKPPFFQSYLSMKEKKKFSKLKVPPFTGMTLGKKTHSLISRPQWNLESSLRNSVIATGKLSGIQTTKGKRKKYVKLLLLSYKRGGKKSTCNSHHYFVFLV